MFKKILAATDGSESASNAVDIASKFAVSEDAELTILHVLLHDSVPAGLVEMAKVEHLVSDKKPTNPIPKVIVAPPRDDESEIVKDELHCVIGQKIVDSASECAKSQGVDRVKTEITDGPTAQRIIEAAKDNESDLIVVGTRGFSELKGLLMGSVSHKVCRLASVPCLTVQ